jgi:hypothetical protein
MGCRAEYRARLLLMRIAAEGGSLVSTKALAGFTLRAAHLWDKRNEALVA